MVQILGHYDRMSKKRLEAFEMWIWRRTERVKWTGRIKKCSSARKSGRRNNNAWTDKEEVKKFAGPLAEKELPAEGFCRRNDRREESSRQKKISDDRQHYDKWTVWRYEKEGWEERRVVNAEFAVKNLPLGRKLWFIECRTYTPRDLEP